MQVTNYRLIKAKRVKSKRERLIDRSLYAELQPALSLANPGRCTVECINSSMKAERSDTFSIRSMQINAPECTWAGANGQLVSDPLFLPALIYSGTIAGERTFRQFALAPHRFTSVPSRTPRSTLSPHWDEFTRCYRVKHADEILKHRFYSVQLTI